MSFSEFWQRLTEPRETEPIPEISDEEIEKLMKMGRIGLRPPGM